MKIVKLQDIKLTHRNPLHSYTPTMRKQKEKFRNIVNIYAFKNGMKKSKTMGVKYIQSNCNIKSEIQFSSVQSLSSV